MKELKPLRSTVKNILLGIILLGIALVLVGLYLAIFTNISTSRGVDGIFIIAGFIAGGFFILVPSKIYLTLQLMKLKDEHRRAINDLDNKNEN